MVKTLIQAGADVNALSSTRNTALIYACASGHIDVRFIFFHFFVLFSNLVCKGIACNWEV